MKNKKNRSKKKKFFDIIFFSLMGFVLSISMFSFFSSVGKTIPTLFGHSIIKILSGSMEASGFDIGDSIIIKKSDSSSLKVGDEIAFYHVLPISKNDATTYSTQINHDTEVWFHEIVDISIIDGKSWYTTKGSSNSNVDRILVSEDYVVGTYVSTPRIVRTAIGFLNSTMGIVVVLLIPNIILLFCLIFEMIGEFERYKLQRKVIKGELLLTDEICLIHHVERGLSRRKKKYILDNASFRLKDEYKKILYD